MELLLNRPLPLAFSSVSFSTPKRSIRIPPKSHKSSSFSSYFTFRVTRNVQVSAHFGGPTSRGNSLRKKLIDDQQVSQKNPTFLTPSSDFENPNLDFDSVNDSSGSVGFSDVVGADSNDLGELESVEGLDPKSRKLGESVLLTRLENWIDQYKEEGAYWGIGYSPIFTVFHDADGNVNRVVVDEDEILRRSQIWKKEADSMVERARGLAREMERGGDVIPRNSSVAKFVFSDEESGFVNSIRAVVLQPEFVPVVSKIGGMVFFGFVAVWALKKLLGSKGKEETYTELEKEMMRRKIKSRKEKEMLEKGRVEVVQERPEPAMMSVERPKLDRQELMKNISEAKFSKDKLLLVDSSSSEIMDSVVLEGELQTIRAMARQAREIESGVWSTDIMDKEEKLPVTEDSSCEMQEVEEHKEEVMSSPSDVQVTDSGKIRNVNETATEKTLNEVLSDNTGFKASSEEIKVINSSNSTRREVSKDTQTMVTGEVSDTPDSELSVSENRSIRTKSRLIRSVKEAREFLAKKGDKLVQEPQLNEGQRSATVLSPHSDEVTSGINSQRGDRNEEVHEPIPLASTSGSLSSANACEDTIPDVKESVPVKSDDSEDPKEGHEVNGLRYPQALHSDTDDSNAEVGQTVKMENWLENNFHEVEPILEKIGDGFRNNYKIAREKKELATNISPDIAELNYKDNESELEWMKDDHLREIVFRVRENELTGREPFYMMDAEDKLKFFKGLEKKVEQENNRLLQVHEYLHSNIENLDYGADGISIHDQPEKFIPRWKGPTIEKNPEFLNNFLEQKNAFFAGSAGTSHPVKKDEQILPHNSTESPVSENIAISSVEYALKKNLHEKDPKDSKIVIEGSDGSVRAGKKFGKEYWQHTKKWSRGFLESYNAETDPEVKSIMKDMGKDLDRWITEEEIQEAADLMTKLPERSKKFMDKKINKLKREMELFGPQAVVSKYSEYADDKEEDYLWWLDLQHILCIELYTIEDEKQRVGFYSLEMAADLELEPKPCHIIAFEDAGGCKNLCYIIQAHLEMLGKGHAFVVPRPPKDAFREARANGFGVTVIRKGEVQLNVDQTLEEVEEQLTEIGSNMYHDKLMQERSVDISSLMKGVFGANGETSSNKRRKR